MGFSRAHIFTMLLLCVSLILGGVAQAQTPAFTPLTWPQKFSLQAGGLVGYPIFITNPGTVTVRIEWVHGPLTYMVQHVDNTLPITQQASPASFDITATAADIQQSPLWMLTIRVSPETSLPKNTKVVGQVMVTGEAPNADAVKVFIATLNTQQSALARTAKTISLSSKMAQMREKELAALAQDAENVRQARFIRLRQQLKTLMPKSSILTTIRPGGTVLPKPPPTIVPGQDLTPKILAVTPATAVPGDTITVKAENLVPANDWSLDTLKRQVAVWFTMNAGVTQYGLITAASKDADGSTLLQVRTLNLRKK